MIKSAAKPSSFQCNGKDRLNVYALIGQRTFRNYGDRRRKLSLGANVVNKLTYGSTTLIIPKNGDRRPEDDFIGLSASAFGVMITLRDDPALAASNIDMRQVAGEIDDLRTRFPNAKLNDDECRRLRGALYLPLLSLSDEDRTRVVDLIMRSLLS